MYLYSTNIQVLIIKCITLNIFIKSQGSFSSSENENDMSLFNDVENKDSLEYASMLIMTTEDPALKLIREISIQAEEEPKITDAKSVGLFKTVESEFDISPLRVKLDKDGNVIFSVLVKTGPCNKLMGFGTKRVYVQVHSTNDEKEMEFELINFMSKILLVSSHNIKYKRGPGRHIKKIIVPISSIKSNYALKRLIDTFRLTKVETFENGTINPPITIKI